MYTKFKMNSMHDIRFDVRIDYLFHRMKDEHPISCDLACGLIWLSIIVNILSPSLVFFYHKPIAPHHSLPIKSQRLVYSKIPCNIIPPHLLVTLGNCLFIPT